MPVHHPVRRAAVLAVAALVLGGCAAGAPAPTAAPPPGDVDPVGIEPLDRADRPEVQAGPHEVSLVADLGPLPDGAGDAVVEMVWTIDGAGTTRLVVDTPAGVTEQHVMTGDEHWWWVSPAVREAIADAEWIHFDLPAIEEVGGELPDQVADARAVVLQPGEIVVGHRIAGHEVLGAEVVTADEVHLTMAGIERAVVHRRRALPEGTTVEVPEDAVDVADLPDVLRW